VPFHVYYTRYRDRHTSPVYGIIHESEMREEAEAQEQGVEEQFDAAILQEADHEALHKTLTKLLPLGMLELVAILVASIRYGGVQFFIPCNPSSGEKGSACIDSIDTLSKKGSSIAIQPASPALVGDSSTEHICLLASASPRYLRQAGRLRTINQLPARDIEMRRLNVLLGQSLHTLPAAVWPGDMSLALSRHAAPRTVILSGHYAEDHWLAETESRFARPVSAQQLVELLRDKAVTMPELVFLNGCDSHAMGKQLVGFLSPWATTQRALYVICCASR